MKRLSLLIAWCALVSFLFAAPARAQEANGSDYWYVDLYGGYLHSGADNLIGFNRFSNGSLVLANPQDFGFAGAAIGRQFSGAGAVKSLEAYFEAIFEEDDSVFLANDWVFRSTNGTTIISTIGPPVFGTAERSRNEGGVRMRFSPPGQGQSRDGWNWLLTGFGGEGKESTFREQTVGSGLSLGRAVSRTDLEFIYGGLMGGFEGSVSLSRTVTFRTSVSGGFYYYDADAHLSSVRGASPAAVLIVGLFEDERDVEGNGVGMRARGQAELDKQLGDRLTISLFGTMDFWTQVPTLENSGPFPLFTQMGVQNVAELRAGARVRVKFGQTN